MRARCAATAAPAELRTPLSADRPGPHGEPAWPRGVPHRPDGPVRGPPWPADPAARVEHAAWPLQDAEAEIERNTMHGAVRVARCRRDAPPALARAAWTRRAVPSPAAPVSVGAAGPRPSAPHPRGYDPRHAARHDRPRARSTRRRSASRCRTSTRRSHLWHIAGPLGLLGAHPRRAGDPRGARRTTGRRAGPRSSTSRSPGVGRDPRWLQRLAEQSGLHLVMGGGWYRTAYYPAGAADRPALGRLAGRGARRRGHRGVGDTGVRTGILGEIGTDKPWVTPSEERVHRAVARAAGAPASPSRPTPCCPTSAPRS